MPRTFLRRLAHGAAARRLRELPVTTLRLLGSFALVAAVLLGGAWMGGAFAESAGSAPRPRLAEPRREGEIPVGDALEVSGQPMQLSLFYTADPPRRVALFYADAFRARGLLPVLAADEGLAHVSAFDPATGRQRFISAIPQPDGQTLVLVGTADPRHPPRFMSGPEGASFPVPPAHRAFIGFRSTDGGARAESAQFVSALGPGEVAGFYRRSLAGEGFSERPDSSASLLSFARPGATVSVALQKLEEQQGAAVFVTRIEGGVP